MSTPNEDETIFGRHYAKFSEYKDPGTILELRMNDFTYKVNYCNMITLVKEFAKNIYKNYHIDLKNGKYPHQHLDSPSSNSKNGSDHITNFSKHITQASISTCGLTMMDSQISYTNLNGPSQPKLCLKEK